MVGGQAAAAGGAIKRTFDQTDAGAQGAPAAFPSDLGDKRRRMEDGQSQM